MSSIKAPKHIRSHCWWMISTAAGLTQTPSIWTSRHKSVHITFPTQLEKLDLVNQLHCNNVQENNGLNKGSFLKNVDKCSTITLSVVFYLLITVSHASHVSPNMSVKNPIHTSLNPDSQPVGASACFFVNDRHIFPMWFQVSSCVDNNLCIVLSWTSTRGVCD